jgi:hypothetical protein
MHLSSSLDLSHIGRTESILFKNINTHKKTKLQNELTELINQKAKELLMEKRAQLISYL